MTSRLDKMRESCKRWYRHVKLNRKPTEKPIWRCENVDKVPHKRGKGRPKWSMKETLIYNIVYHNLIKSFAQNRGERHCLYPRNRLYLMG